MQIHGNLVSSLGSLAAGQTADDVTKACAPGRVGGKTQGTNQPGKLF